MTPRNRCGVHHALAAGRHIAAVLQPQNAHNVQPWRVVPDEMDASRFDRYIATERLLPQTDPPAHQTTHSRGTFRADVESRAAALGYRAAPASLEHEVSR